MTNSFKSSTNKATTNMKNHARCSFILNESHEEEEPPTDNENVPHLKRNTPILFSTNRGLHLRMGTATTTTLSPHTTSLTSANTAAISKINSSYSMVFCDLERWSTNRANTISLEDTFTMPESAIISASRASNSLTLLPHLPTSVRFNGYSRFDEE